MDALKAAGITPTPARYRWLRLMPPWLLAMALREGLATERAEIVMASHANGARDEMEHLYAELRGIITSPVPAMDRLAGMSGPSVNRGRPFGNSCSVDILLSRLREKTCAASPKYCESSYLVANEGYASGMKFWSRPLDC